MKKYAVAVEIVQFDEIEIWAEDEDDACDQAHEMLDRENYDSYDVIDIVETGDTDGKEND